jgi:hypothetical protein
MAAEAQSPQPSTPSNEALLKEIKGLESEIERIKRERETDGTKTSPTETIMLEKRLEYMRRELRNLRPLLCEAYRDGRWVGMSCWEDRD